MARKLADIYADLSFGPLAEMAIGMKGTGAIRTDDEDRLVFLINAGLDELHSRFLLHEKELRIRVIEGNTLYPLDPAYADTGTGDTKFIVDDEAQPFVFDVVRLLVAFDPEGEELPINDYEDERSVFTPVQDVVQIPNELEAASGEVFSFLYQASHPKIGVGDNDQLVRLPIPLYQALNDYVASRIFMSMNGQEHRARGAELMASFEAACALAVENNTVAVSLNTTTSKLENRGFK